MGGQGGETKAEAPILEYQIAFEWFPKDCIIYIYILGAWGGIDIITFTYTKTS
jgi:hypothetical protein